MERIVLWTDMKRFVFSCIVYGLPGGAAGTRPNNLRARGAPSGRVGGDAA
jgi:hypothetical protein